MITGRFRLLPNDPELGWTPWAWLIYLVPFVAAPFYINEVAPHRAATLLGSATFLVLYFAAYWNRGTRLLLIISAIVALGCVFLPIARVRRCSSSSPRRSRRSKLGATNRIEAARLARNKGWL